MEIVGFHYPPTSDNNDYGEVITSHTTIYGICLDIKVCTPQYYSWFDWFCSRSVYLSQFWCSFYLVLKYKGKYDRKILSSITTLYVVYQNISIFIWLYFSIQIDFQQTIKIEYACYLGSMACRYRDWWVSYSNILKLTKQNKNIACH